MHQNFSNDNEKMGRKKEEIRRKRKKHENTERDKKRGRNTKIQKGIKIKKRNKRTIKTTFFLTQHNARIFLTKRKQREIQ